MGEGQPINKGESKLGGCLRAAFQKSGIDDTGVPNWLTIEELPALCGRLNLTLHVNTQVKVRGDQHVIGIYENAGPGIAHAEYLDAQGLRELIKIGVTFNAILELPA